MSPEQWNIVLIVFGVVAVLIAIMVVFAVVVTRKRAKLNRAAPGHPRVAVPADPWRRFGPALAAVYAQNEWQRTRGARRVFTADQTFFGYGCVVPYGALRSQLARDWGVKKADEAFARVFDVKMKSVASAAQVVGARGETPTALLQRLAAAGVPAAAAELVADAVPAGGATEDRGAGALPSLGFDLVRFANLVRWAGCYGYLTEQQAHDASDALGAAAVAVFGGWAELGENYSIGLQEYTRRGTKPYLKAVEWLLSEPMSPWSTLPWPAPRVASGGAGVSA